ncbi:hypothetical protein GIW81_00895 [Hyphomicrobium sp. xq]|uniref:Capsid Gp10A/Gp10B-like domain-containing protein n=1 Tax=Hyphomicrobium album TaxID=2665159 RepID=A0A6I3KBT4_9HYPH|nr:hypothetical protein [Hyphomicrobium album]MTD92885.1 hypothetical protein [Hyphomicrobium album]
MVNATISRQGVVNAVDPTNWYDPEAFAEFQEIFAGEVLTAFAETHVFGNLHYVRTISSGKGAFFPATWKATAAYHQPGVPIVGSNKIKQNRRLINVDHLLVSDVFIDDLEDAMNHFDVRQIYSKQIGEALANRYDVNVARVLVKAARASATISGAVGGSALTHADAKTVSSRLVSMIFNANQVFDEKDIPPSERYCGLKPAQYYLIVQDEKVQNTQLGGHGLYMQGKVPFIGDTAIVKSNYLPTTNVSSGTNGEQNDYTGDFTKTAGICWHRSAAGTVKLKEVSTQATAPQGDFNAMYQGTLLLGKYAMGHGILRPESAVELALP